MDETNSSNKNSKKLLVVISLGIVLVLVGFFYWKSIKVSDNQVSQPNVKGAESSKQIIFAQNKPQPFNSDWIDTSGFTKITINLAMTKWITQYSVEYSSDQVNITEQSVVSCGNNLQCPETTLPLLGKYYRITTGTALGDVTATGVLN